MIYTITASYGEYEDRCDTKMYMTVALNDCQTVMLEMQQNIIAAFKSISVSGSAATVNCAESIRNLALHARHDGRVYLSISSMQLGVVETSTFVESIIAESVYNGCDYISDELPLPSKYEILALPYEAKYYGYKH